MIAATHDQIPEMALNWWKSGKKVALATVIDTWGSAPRPRGSQLVIDGDAGMAGSVSGGCVEAAVVAEALTAMVDGQPRILDYGVSDEEAFAVGLACGGRIRVLVEPVGGVAGLDTDILEELVSARSLRQPTVYAVNRVTWERRLISGPPDLLWDAAQLALLSDQSTFQDDWFLGVHNPPLRMAVIGAVHIAQALVPMAVIAGYDVAVIDPRSAFLTASRFPDVRLIEGWPDEALAEFGLDARTAVVTLTHDPKIDDPSIRSALASPVFYLGSLGSKRTHAKRLERLTEAGIAPAELRRIHAPVGANIGAKSPAEIAISILAEITERLRRPETRP